MSESAFLSLRDKLIFEALMQWGRQHGVPADSNATVRDIVEPEVLQRIVDVATETALMMLAEGGARRN